MSREVMQQALDALVDLWNDHLDEFDDQTDRAIQALRSELAKPVAQGWYCAHCERGVDPIEVTFNEAHEACGRIITNDEPPTAKPAAVPDGWVLVPREPTHEMLWECFPLCSDENARSDYAALLAATPQPPAPVVDVEAVRGTIFRMKDNHKLRESRCKPDPLISIWANELARAIGENLDEH